MLVHVLSMTPGQQAKLKYRRAAACASYPVCHFHYGTGWCRCWLLVVCTIAGRSVVKPTVRSLLSTLRCPLSASIAVVGCPAVHAWLSIVRLSIVCSPISAVTLSHSALAALCSALWCLCPCLHSALHFPAVLLRAYLPVRVFACHAVMLSCCRAVMLSRCHAVRCSLSTGR